MPDHMDHVQDEVLTQQQMAIAQATQPKGPGLRVCSECGESISELRQDLGARLCLDHQQEAEQRARHRSRG